MKKLLGILVLGLLWCNAGNAGIKEPGQDPKCLKKGMKEFNGEVKQNLNENEPLVFYVGCKDSASATWWWKGAGLDGNHKGAYKKCLGRAKERGIDDCYLFSIHDVVVWGKDASFVSKVEKEIYKKIASKVSEKNKEKDPITPESISGWDVKCDKGEDFIKYVATVEGCIGIKSIGKPDKSKKKLVIFLHGDYKGKEPHDPKRYSGFSKVIKDQKENINFFFIARPGHQFPGRKRSAGKWKNYESINQNPDRVVWKKGWGSIKLISQTIYRLKEFYQAEQVIAIGMSGGAQDVSVMSGKVPGLIDVAILGGCDCMMEKRGFWLPKDFIKTTPPEMPIIMISGEKDDYLERAKNYHATAKREGLNIELHIVKGGHDARKTLIAYGKDIIKEVLK